VRGRRGWGGAVGLAGGVSAAIAVSAVLLSACTVLAPVRNRLLGLRAIPPDSQSLLAVECGVNCVVYRYPLAAPSLGGDGLIRIPVRRELEVTWPWSAAEFRSRYGPGRVIRHDPLGNSVWQRTPKTGWILIDCQQQRVAPWASSPTPPATVQHRDSQGRLVFTEETWQPAFVNGEPSSHRMTGGAHQLYVYFCR